MVHPVVTLPESNDVLVARQPNAEPDLVNACGRAQPPYRARNQALVVQLKASTRLLCPGGRSQGELLRTHNAVGAGGHERVGSRLVRRGGEYHLPSVVRLQGGLLGSREVPVAPSQQGGVGVSAIDGGHW